MAQKITHKHQKCPKCGYSAIVLKQFAQCPMCKICSGCGKRIIDCSCIPSE